MVRPIRGLTSSKITYFSVGPPSQSLGVDPVDPIVMRRPPRRKDAPIVNKRLLYRVIFSASIIVVETLFIYIYALSDDRMSRREQTMVSSSITTVRFAHFSARYLFPIRHSHVSSSWIWYLRSRTVVLVAQSPETECLFGRFLFRSLCS